MKIGIQILKEYLIITFGTLLVAIGVYFFKFPNNFAIGGVSGISVVLGAVFPGISAGTFVLILNAILLLFGFLLFGRSFGIKTVYSSILFSLSIFILEKVIPMSKPFTNQPFLELIFSVIFPAVGNALLFNTGASTGGTDMIALVLKKYTHLNIGKAMFAIDSIITVSSFFVFDMEIGMFSVAGLLLRMLIVNNVIEDINLSKYFMIITDSSQEINDYILNTLNRTATMWKCNGAFSNDEKTLILTVINRSESILLKKYTKTVDKDAFVIISNTSDIIGKRFKEVI